MPDNWAEVGGELNLPQQLEDDGKTFYFSKRYDASTSRFVDYIEEAVEPLSPCFCCKLVLFIALILEMYTLFIIF